MVRDGKGVFEKRPLLAELKFKTLEILESVTFSILALPPEGTFQMLTHFKHPWPLGNKNQHSDF